MPRIGAASRPGWFSNTKRYIQEDLRPTLPSYKHPEFIHSSNIGIVFDLNVYTRADFSLPAQITSNSNFYIFMSRAQFTVAFFQWWRGSSLETYGNHFPHNHLLILLNFINYIRCCVEMLQAFHLGLNFIVGVIYYSYLPSGFLHSSNT